MLQEGLTIIGRQVALDSGKADLLAIDSNGSVVVIEIKRGVLYRDSLAQVLDYASSIALKSSDELEQMVKLYQPIGSSKSSTSIEKLLDDQYEVSIIVVGTGRDPALDRMAAFLSGKYNVPISVISYEVFEVESGEHVLVRELSEVETTPPVPNPPPPSFTVARACSLADDNGIGAPFRAILAAAEHRGLYPRATKWAVRFAPPVDHRYSLFAIWGAPDPGKLGRVKSWIGVDQFAKYYPVTEEQAAMRLGPSGWRDMTPTDAADFVTRLDALFEDIAAARSEADSS